jgi:hypothetical protein
MLKKGEDEGGASGDDGNKSDCSSCGSTSGTISTSAFGSTGRLVEACFDDSAFASRAAAIFCANLDSGFVGVSFPFSGVLIGGLGLLEPMDGDGLLIPAPSRRAAASFRF